MHIRMYIYKHAMQLNSTIHCVQGTILFGTITKAICKKMVPKPKGALKQISLKSLFGCLVFQQGLCFLPNLWVVGFINA